MRLQIKIPLPVFIVIAKGKCISMKKALSRNMIRRLFTGGNHLFVCTLGNARIQENGICENGDP
jgi:hypothetical protein